VYVAVAVGETSCVPPVISFVPVQEASPTLVATQEVALPLAQVNVLEPPRAIVVKSAISEAPGAAPTVTVASTVTSGSMPSVQVSEYVAVEGGFTSTLSPVELLMPSQLGSAVLLVPVQPVAAVTVHVSVDAPPSAIVVGSALKVMTGAAWALAANNDNAPSATKAPRPTRPKARRVALAARANVVPAFIAERRPSSSFRVK
jgi:hypothetical protein